MKQSTHPIGKFDIYAMWRAEEKPADFRQFKALLLQDNALTLADPLMGKKRFALVAMPYGSRPTYGQWRDAGYHVQYHSTVVNPGGFWVYGNAPVDFG